MSPWVPRVLLGLGAVAIAGAVISIAVGEGGEQPRNLGGVNDVQRIFGGIEQEGAFLGDADAPVTVSVFNDIQCTGCADFQIETVDPLIEEHARGGDVRFEFRHFSLAPNDTTLAAIAAEAAGEQARQWQYLDTFVRNQDAIGGEVSEEILRQVAEAVPNLDLDLWEEDFASSEAEEAARADAMLAAELRLPAEPAVVVSGPGGTRELTETPSGEEIESAIAAVGSEP